MIKIVLIVLALTLFSGCTYSPARLALAASANTRQCIHTHNHTHTQRQQTPAPTPAPSDTQPEDIMDEINAARKKYGQPILTYNTELERGAFIRAKEASADFCHYRPDGSPCTTVSEIADGEVLFRGPWSSDSAVVIECWLDSPLHRDAILRNDEMEMGVGYYLDESTGTVAWCVLFHLI